jgi:formylglycine-generating enzyme required for sulfatase activity
MQSDDHPVVCVSWNDAQAFVSWLNQQSGQKFRLPSEAEWEYAARAGNVAKYPWGMDADQACRFANGGDQTPYPDNSGRAWANPLNCKDGYFYTAPVGSFASSDFGLKDMIGNALEWTQDCENESYSGAPSDGSAWTSGNCDRRVVRGGSWAVGAASLRVSYRGRTGAANRHDNDGFRLAHD